MWFAGWAAPERTLSPGQTRIHRLAHRQLCKVGVHPEMGLREGGNFKHKVPGTPGSRASGAAPPPVPERRALSRQPPAARPAGSEVSQPDTSTHPPQPTSPSYSRSPSPAPPRSPEARRVPGRHRRRAPHTPRDAAPPPTLTIGPRRRLGGLPLVRRRGPNWSSRVT